MPYLQRLAQRWSGLRQRLGSKALPATAWGELVGLYGEPHRAYHTLEHVGECLALLDRFASLAMFPTEVELAVWYHDAIYDPRRSDNEARSAALCLARLDAPTGVVSERIQQLILATTHGEGQALAEGDCALLLDIDLAILGASTERFERYEAAIRYEYAFVPDETFYAVRGELLHRLLERPTLYQLPEFQRQFEGAARSNLAHLLQHYRAKGRG